MFLIRHLACWFYERRVCDLPRCGRAEHQYGLCRFHLEEETIHARAA